VARGKRVRLATEISNGTQGKSDQGKGSPFELCGWGKNNPRPDGPLKVEKPSKRKLTKSFDDVTG